MGGCYDGSPIYSLTPNEDDDDCDRAFGYVEYPPCGMCPQCCYVCDYEPEAIRKVAERRDEWLRQNPNRYVCKWTHRHDSGDFTFQASDLADARKKAQQSMLCWDSLLVQPYKR